MERSKLNQASCNGLENSRRKAALLIFNTVQPCFGRESILEGSTKNLFIPPSYSLSISLSLSLSLSLWLLLPPPPPALDVCYFSPLQRFKCVVIFKPYPGRTRLLHGKANSPLSSNTKGELPPDFEYGILNNSLGRTPDNTYHPSNKATS